MAISVGTGKLKAILSFIPEFTIDKGVHCLLEGTALADAMMRSLDHVICVCDMGMLSM